MRERENAKEASREKVHTTEKQTIPWESEGKQSLGQTTYYFQLYGLYQFQSSVVFLYNVRCRMSQVQ